MSSKVDIRLMTPDDAQFVSDLGAETIQLQVYADKNTYYGVDQIRAATNNSNEICLVAEVAGQIAGFVMVHINPVFNEAYLSDIAIKPQFRRLGISKLFFQEVHKLFTERRISWAWALVQDENQIMQDILKQYGFTKGRKFYFFIREFD